MIFTRAGPILVPMKSAASGNLQVSSVGDLRLPPSVRRRLKLRPGDTLRARVLGRHIVLEKASEPDLEAYSEARMREFARAARLSRKELAKARQKWGL